MYRLLSNCTTFYECMAINTGFKLREIASNRTQSHLTIANRTKSYKIISNRLKSYQIVSNRIKSYQIVSNRIKMCQIRKQWNPSDGDTVLAPGPFTRPSHRSVFFPSRRRRFGRGHPVRLCQSGEDSGAELSSPVVMLDWCSASDRWMLTFALRSKEFGGPRRVRINFPAPDDLIPTPHPPPRVLDARVSRTSRASIARLSSTSSSPTTSSPPDPKPAPLGSAEKSTAIADARVPHNRAPFWIKKRKITLFGRHIGSMSMSEAAGHLSFLFLGLNYAHTDFLLVKTYAALGMPRLVVVASRSPPEN